MTVTLTTGSTTVDVMTGPRLLDNVGRALSLPQHRRRWPDPGLVSRDNLIEITRQVSLTGRGGAGFPFATKLASVSDRKRPVVIINASEGEPGSFKDSVLGLTAPHLVLDGATVVARALQANTVHLVVGSESPAVADVYRQAIKERGRLPKIVMHLAEPHFVAGQEQAILQLLKGSDNLPVTAWDRPGDRGFRGRPTLLSNAETFAQIAAIWALGADEYASLGIEGETGTMLLTVSGPGRRPIVMEAEYGAAWEQVTGADVISGPVLLGGYHGSWAPPGELLAGQVSQAWARPLGMSLGAGVVWTIGERCPVAETATIVDYLAAASAKRCGPCRNGLPALATSMTQLTNGHDSHRRILELADVLPGRGACAHPDGTVRLVRSLLRAYPAEVAAHRQGLCHTDTTLLVGA